MCLLTEFQAAFFFPAGFSPFWFGDFFPNAQHKVLKKPYAFGTQETDRRPSVRHDFCQGEYESAYIPKRRNKEKRG